MIQFCVTLVCEFHGSLVGGHPPSPQLVVGVDRGGGSLTGPQVARGAPRWLSGQIQVSPRRQSEAEKAGHDDLAAIDLVPDETLAGGLRRWLVECLVNAGYPSEELGSLHIDTLRVRITGYRYLHALLILEADSSQLARLEALTPHTVTTLVLDYLEVLQPVFSALAHAGVLELDADSVFGAPLPLVDLGLMTPLEDTYLYDRHVVLSGVDRDGDS